MRCGFISELEPLELIGPEERERRRSVRSLPGRLAAGRLPAMLGDRDRCAELRRAAAAAEPWRDLSGVSDEELVRRAQDELRDGRAVLQAPPKRELRVRHFYDRPTAMPDDLESEAEDLSDHHYVAFAVLDGNGDPYPGLEYVLAGPADETETGQLDDAAEVRKDDVFESSYTLTICEVVSVTWARDAVSPEEDVVLNASVAGYDDGTEVEIRLFRRWRETDDDVVDTITATVEGSAVTATWCYTHDPDGPLGDLDGVVPIVAEVRVGTDGPWAKTLEPLALQLPTLEDARWSVDTAAPGQDVEMELRTPGVADGVTVTIEVFAQWRTGEQECLESLTGLAVEGEVVRTSWKLEPEDDEEAGPAEAECFFVATLDDDADKVATSESLWVTAHTA